MSPLEQLRAAQHDDLQLASDHAFTAFLAEVSPNDVLLDLEPLTEVELRHLMHTRAAA